MWSPLTLVINRGSGLWTRHLQLHCWLNLPHNAVKMSTPLSSVWGSEAWRRYPFFIYLTNTNWSTVCQALFQELGLLDWRRPKFMDPGNHKLTVEFRLKAVGFQNACVFKLKLELLFENDLDLFLSFTLFCLWGTSCMKNPM